MFLSGDERIAEDPTDLVGLKVSAGLLVALGCIFGLYVPYIALLLIVESVRRWHGHQPTSGELIGFLGLLIDLALTYLCFQAASALRIAQRWAANVAIGFGLMLLALSGSFFYDWFHPEKQGPDEYFLILIVPFWIVIGLWWCIYLNVRSVRSVLRSNRRGIS